MRGLVAFVCAWVAGFTAGCVPSTSMPPFTAGAPFDAGAQVDPPDASCEAATRFSAVVTDLSAIEHIVPLGSAASGEIKDHVFFGVKAAVTEVPVYAPAAADLLAVAHYKEPGVPEQFLLDFRVNCAVTFRFDHIVSVVDRIRAVAPAAIADGTGSGSISGPVHVEAGELIGHTTLHSWDLGVQSASQQNLFAVQSRYENQGESRSIHAVCPFAYYDAPMRAAYSALLGGNGGAGTCTGCGSASQDAPGKLSGEWFKDAPASGIVGSHFSIAKACDGKSVSVSGLPGASVNADGGADPSTATEACYDDFSGTAWVYLRVASPLTVEVATGSGACPPAFPSSGAERWQR